MLTTTKVRNTKPGAKPYKLADERGLYLLVKPTGAKCWRFKYRHGGHEHLLSFGMFPDVGLAEARGRRDDARRKLRDGIDPAAEQRAMKANANATFATVAAEWLERQREALAAATFTKAEHELKLARGLNDSPVRTLTAPDVLRVLRRIESRGTIETAHRVRQRLSQVLRYAVATGHAEHDVTQDLRGALAPVVTTSRAALTNPNDVAGLLRALDAYVGQPATEAALKLAPLLFVRPGNLRAMEWAELDLDGSAPEWRIPADKMKMREEHVVPLAPQAVAILRELQPLTGRGRYVFPSLRTPHRPMSENTVNAALRRMGYDKTAMTGHGFRALASTRLNELGWAPDVIERQLAHVERNKTRAAYNRASYLPERRKMMQAWADYLDGLRNGASVTPIRRQTA